MKLSFKTIWFLFHVTLLNLDIYVLNVLFTSSQPILKLCEVGSTAQQEKAFAIKPDNLKTFLGLTWQSLWPPHVHRQKQQ